MDNAITLIEFKLERLKKEVNLETTEGKIEYLNKSRNLEISAFCLFILLNLKVALSF